MFNDFSCMKLLTRGGETLSCCWMNSLECPVEELIHRIRDRELLTVQLCRSDWHGRLSCGIPYPVEKKLPKDYLTKPVNREKISHITLASTI